MIKELVKRGCETADRLILLDALNEHYETLFASDGNNVTDDLSVLPHALVWIYDRGAVAVVAVQQETGNKYLAEVSIRPYTRDGTGRQVLCDALHEHHDRCQTAAREAAVALAIHVAERRLRMTVS